MAIQRVKFAVLMEDGTEYPEVTTNLFDQVAYDRERIRRRWPPMQDNQMTFAAFTAYSAMRRQSLYAGTYDEFLNAVAAVEEYDDSKDDDEVDPYGWTDPADAYEPVPSMAQEMAQMAEPRQVDPTQPGVSPRLIVELAVATNTMPSWWFAETDEVIATALDVLEEQAEQAKG